MFNISRTDSFKAQEIVCKLAEIGAMAIFGPGSIETSGIVSSMTEKLEIPHLIYHWKTKPRQSQDYKDPKMTLNFYPESEALAKTVAGILIDYTWKSYTIIYENEENLIRLKDILQIHQPNGDNLVTMMKLEDENYAILLKKVKWNQVKNVVLDISTDKIVPFLQAAKLVGMIGDYNKYFITNLDSYTLDYGDLIESLVNISSIRINNVSSVVMADALKNINAFGEHPLEAHQMPLEAALIHDAIHFFVNGLDAYVQNPNNARMKPSSCSDIRDSPRSSQPSFGYGLLEFLRAREYNGITNHIEFSLKSSTQQEDKEEESNESPKRGSRTEFMLDILEYSKELKQYHRIAYFDTTKGVVYERSEDDKEEKIFAEIQNKTFTIVTRAEAPFIFYNSIDKNGNPLLGNDQFTGYAVDLIRRIQGQLRFKYIFKLVDDNKNGNFDKEKNEWNGLIGDILKGRADLAIADLTITYDRKKVVDFTTPFMNLGISILYVKPKPKAKNLFSFLDPFKTDVWIYTGCAYIFISVLVFVLSRINNDDWESSHPCNQDPDEVESIWNVLNCVWLMMGSIMGQGSDILPKGSSTRIVTGMWWFFALIMLASYTANLAAFLTSDRLSSTISGAEDLAKQVEIKYGAVQGGSTMRFFQESNYSTYQRMWATMESNADIYNPPSNDEGVNRVEKESGKYAFMMESVPMEYQTKRRCTLMQVGEWLDSKGYGIALPLESPYRKFFSAQILKLQESGVLAQLKEDWWKAPPGKECSPIEVPHDDLDIGNVGGVFLVLIGGCLVAFFVACIEFFINVQHVAINEKITHWDAFKSELAFAFNFWIVTKPVRSQSNEIVSRKSTPQRSLKSRSRFGSETRSFKNKSTRSLNFDSSLHEATSKSLLNLH
ncbi:glutamate receptor ionotropic, kainate 2-like [Chironomus tepperi]|uniref:glutamate receptor ionotropic, kainate 2-like n=1 Tax=Chironomus tepperi TaxID=113505 RepID=UPI00391FB8A3